MHSSWISISAGFKSVANHLFAGLYQILTFIANKIANLFRSNQDAFYKAAREQDFNKLNKLLNKKNVNPAGENNYALLFNLRNRDAKGTWLKIVMVLLKRKEVTNAINKQAKQNSHGNLYALQCAAVTGYEAIVKLICALSEVKTALQKKLLALTPNHNLENFCSDFPENSKRLVYAAANAQSVQTHAVPVHTPPGPVLIFGAAQNNRATIDAITNCKFNHSPAPYKPRLQ